MIPKLCCKERHFGGPKRQPPRLRKFERSVLLKRIDASVAFNNPDPPRFFVTRPTVNGTRQGNFRHRDPGPAIIGFEISLPESFGFSRENSVPIQSIRY